MRILMICPQFRPLVGGYERAAERLSVALAAAGHDVVIIAERREGSWPAVERFDGCELRRLRCLHRRNLHTMSSAVSFAAFLLRHGRRFDVWHVHQYGIHAAVAVALGKLLRRPAVVKSTNSGPMGIASTLGGGIIGKVMGDLHRRVGAYIAISDETREEAIQFGVPEAHIHEIPNGLDDGRFRPVSAEARVAARHALGLACRRLVLFVGRLSAEKNASGLMDAWARIDRRHRDGALLAFVGDGPELELLRARARAPDVMGTVHLAGQRDDVAVWYRAADIYVIASWNEGLANTMIEALACGLPVVSTRVSGSSALVQPPRSGVVVDVGDATGLAGAIEALLKDDAWRTALGRNARLTFERLFALQSVTKKMIDLYATLVPPRDTRKPA